MKTAKKIKIQSDIAVFGSQVKLFPEGIKAAFDDLTEMLPGGFDRSFYGISYMSKDGKMIYIAAAEEKIAGEAEKYKCERHTIPKGEYLTIAVKDWRNKTDSINGIFHQIIEDERANKTTPAVEWYKNDEEMLCMVKALDT